MEESTHHIRISVNSFMNIKCLAQPTCVINSGYYNTTFYSSAASVSVHSAVLSAPKSVPPPAASLYSSLASTPFLRIQGQYFSNSCPDPLLHHRLFFSFSTEIVPSAYKYLLYWYFFHLGKKKTKIKATFSWSSLPCQLLTYFFVPLCNKILERAFSTHCLQFPFYSSFLNSFQSISWPHQSTATALIKVTDLRC